MSTALISLMIPGMADAVPKRDFAGNRIRALPDSVWKVSEWISVADAPVVTGRVEGNNERAADGAGWFVTKVRNSKKVISARWMTTGQGVYKLLQTRRDFPDRYSQHYADSGAVRFEKPPF